jgi:hypothetical protein
MALFDFPRIHFSGNIDINVPTINNSYYFPLTIYDQVHSRPFLPPRLYFSDPKIPAAVHANINPAVIPDPENGYCYIEICPINNIDILRQWCMTPLGGADSPDKEYIPFYQAAYTDLCKVESTPELIGIAPGYWNMFGDMGVSMSNVRVTGVQTLEEGQVRTWTKDSSNPPKVISMLLDAAIDMDASPASGRTTAVMAETISSQSIYANIFSSTVNLYNKNNPEIIYLKGKPFRFSALLYAAWRVVNWLPAMAGSARWCSSIPLESLDPEMQYLLIDFFRENKTTDSRIIKGVFVSFTTHEVFENRYDQTIYQHGSIQNPAQATTIGSITPLYEGDMKTGIAARNLIALGMNSFYTNTGTGNPIPISLTPALAHLQVLPNGHAIFSLDMGNSWPELMNPGYQDGKVQPAKRGDASFETFALGKLSVRYDKLPTTEFAHVMIDPVSNPISRVKESGCIFDTLITDTNLINAIQSNLIKIYATVNGEDTQLLQEAQYSLATDQKGLYAEEGDDPNKGYMVYNDERIPCRLRIFRLGKPVTTPVEILVAEYKVPEAANDPLAGPDNVYSMMLADNDIVDLANGALTLNNSAVYYFVYNGQYPDNNIPAFNTTGYTIQDTGSFACLRVYPKTDYSRYLDPHHQQYNAPDFDVVYKEVFQLYDIVYPAMAAVHPFTREVWDNGIMSGLAVQRTDPSIWSDILYMSRSRELNPSQRRLLEAWADTYNENNLAPLLPLPQQSLAPGAPRFTVRLREIVTPREIPLVQSCAWAVNGNKLLIVGGLTEGFHGLNQDQPTFGSKFVNSSLIVINLDTFEYRSLSIKDLGPQWQPLISSNMQFVQDGEVLYIAGGYGPKAPTDKQSNYTFPVMTALDLPTLINAVETGSDSGKGILASAESEIFRVAGGELFKSGEAFYLAFGQDFSKLYDPGTSGDYISDIRIFSFEDQKLKEIGICKDPNLHRRDLNAVAIMQNSGIIYAGLGGVFDPSDNGYMQPVLFDPTQPNCGIRLDPLRQVTNQYSCAHASIFDEGSNTCVTVLMGGIGQYQYHPETGEWENGDNGAKLPFVKSISQIYYTGGQMQQYIQLPPDQPEMPKLIGANAIFIPNNKLLNANGFIDYGKINLGESVIGLFYGGIESQLPTSSEIYPTSVNKILYEVIIRKT